MENRLPSRKAGRTEVQHTYSKIATSAVKDSVECVKSRPGGTPYNGVYEEASFERGSFFWVQVYRGFQRIGKSVF